MIKRQLFDAEDANIDLTGASVRFHMRAPDGTLKIDAAAVIDGAPTSGVARYNWVAADTDTAGCFISEWEVTYVSGAIETFPNDSHETITIFEDLA